MKKSFLTAFTLAMAISGLAQDVTVNVDARKDQKTVSPYIYGRNNNFSNVFGTATSASDIQLYKEAGLRFARENTGNNATKYNWRLKISSHPDWYNNVYSHNWDYAAQTIASNTPSMQTMWAFQLIGKVAANKNNNFNDWSYNQSQWWNGVSQNLAGGGQVNPNGGGDALVEGDPDLYLMDWPADSTTEILNHWFGNGGLGLNSENFKYWSMDNEPEIWNGTHDDVMPNQISASDFMDRYFEVAKKAREKYPDIKLTGPVPANEWQWFKYADESLKINGTYYCWLEYFIKRVADEQKATGIRLLDAIDVHWYPSESSNAEVLQLHRIFFDETYSYPGANGLKTINGSWNNSSNKEYIFKRINDWLTKHFGEKHGITIALTESGINNTDPNINSVLYASLLGTFANNGIEIYTPWTWRVGMWETLHLFSRYAKNISVSSTSSLENTVSAYTTINNATDSMTVVLVNRNLSASKEVAVNIAGLSVPDGSYTTLTLSSLPSSETFKSHSSNALKSGTVSVSGDSLLITLPALSTTAVILKTNPVAADIFSEGKPGASSVQVFPNPATNFTTVSLLTKENKPSTITIYDHSGRITGKFTWENSGEKPFTFSTEQYAKGVYFIRVTNDQFSTTRKLTITR